MAHWQKTEFRLKSKSKSVFEILKPYLCVYFVKEEDADSGIDSIGLNFKKILPVPKNLTKEKKDKWKYKNWGSRHFVLNGTFNNNSYYFSSINNIPFKIYHKLAKLIGENFTVEINSIDDCLECKFEFNSKGLVRCIYLAEVDKYGKPKFKGKLSQSRKKNFIKLYTNIGAIQNCNDIIKTNNKTINTNKSHDDVPF